MGFMKRAFLYVTRKRGRSILLFLLYLIMATFVLTGLSVSMAAQSAQSRLRETLGGRFTLSADYSQENPYVKSETDEEGNSNIYTELPITRELIDAVMSVGNIKSYDAAAQTLVTTELNIFPGNVPVKSAFKHSATARIVESTENSSFFQSGTLRLAEGSHITENQSGVALISTDLAERNGLKLGDTLPLQGAGAAAVRLIGIFEIIRPDSPLSMLTSFEKLENQIFTDLETFQKLVPDLTAGFQTVRFEVADPAQLSNTMSQLKGLSSIDWRAFKAEEDNQAYLASAGPLMNLQSLMSAVLIAIALISAVILSLILTMWSKSRIHETGVFLSVGIGKASIIGQYLAESLIIAVLAFGFSYFTGNAIAGGIGNELLRHSAPQDQPEGANSVPLDMTTKGSADGITAIPKGSEYSATDTPEENRSQDSAAVSVETQPIQVAIGLYPMIELCLIGFIIIAFSTGVSSASIMRLKPREILTKMS